MTKSLSKTLYTGLLAGAAVAALSFGSVGEAQAGAKALSVLQILNLAATNAATGTPGNAGDRGTILTDGVDINIIGTPGVTSFASGNYNAAGTASVAAPAPLQCAGIGGVGAGDCAGIAENDFTSQGGNSGDQNFGRGDTNLAGAIINGTLAGPAPATVQMVSEGEQTQTAATAGVANTGLNATFDFTVGVGIEVRLSFDGIAELIAQQHPLTNGSTFAEHGFSVSVTNAAGTEIFNWTPGGAIFGGVEEAAAGNLNNNESTNSPNSLNTASVNGFFAASTNTLGANCVVTQCTLTFTGSTSASTTVQKIPEPSTLALLGTGLLALGFFGRRNRKAA